LRLADHRSVDRDPPRGGEFGSLGPGEAEHAGDGGVDALALQAVGHGQGTDLGKRAHPVEYAGPPGPSRTRVQSLWTVPSGSRPRKDSSTMRMPPHTIAESARLNTAKCFSAMKSTTATSNTPGDRKIRSVRLPGAQPRNRPSALAQGRPYI